MELIYSTVTLHLLLIQVMSCSPPSAAIFRTGAVGLDDK